ncbi:protein kinase domain-containing protein [Fagus crenata]
MKLSNYTEDTIVYTEAVYDVIGNSTTVCVAQTLPNQLPFISALELRSLGSNMYRHGGSNTVLVLANRAFQSQGANQNIRHPDDPYDRIWIPYSAAPLEEVITSGAATIDVSTAEDQPPQAVVRNAITTTATGWNPRLDTRIPGERNIYITIYFSEVTLLNSTQKRSMQIYINNNPYLNPIIPPFGSVLEVYITNMTASTNTTFSVGAASDSTLLPLINAYEVYTANRKLSRRNVMSSSSPPPPLSPPPPPPPSSPPPPIKTQPPPSKTLSSINSIGIPPPPTHGTYQSQTPFISATGRMSGARLCICPRVQRSCFYFYVMSLFLTSYIHYN